MGLGYMVGRLWYRMNVPIALWVMADFLDAEHTVPRFEKNIISLKATLHFPYSITTSVGKWATTHGNTG